MLEKVPELDMELLEQLPMARHVLLRKNLMGGGMQMNTVDGLV